MPPGPSQGIRNSIGCLCIEQSCGARARVSGGFPGPRFRRALHVHHPGTALRWAAYFGSLDSALTRPTHRKRTLVGQNTANVSWPERAGISLATFLFGWLIHARAVGRNSPFAYCAATGRKRAVWLGIDPPRWTRGETVQYAIGHLRPTVAGQTIARPNIHGSRTFGTVQSTDGSYSACALGTASNGTSRSRTPRTAWRRRHSR
jgi:hypothetical protein